MMSEHHDTAEAMYNLDDYHRACKEFNWASVEKEFDWSNGGKFNLAHESVDKHANSWRKNKIALYWVGPNDEVRKYTFGEMKVLSNRVANALRGMGAERGDRVLVFLDRIPEVYQAAQGIVKMGGIFGPMFSAFGPEAVKDRVLDSGARFLITQPYLYERIEGIMDELTNLETIIMVGNDWEIPEGCHSFHHLVEEASPEFEAEDMSPTDPYIIHYTSGTTGKPKGVLLGHRAMMQQALTARWVLDLREEDTYWCTADPGWVTGTSYGIFGPWLLGSSLLCYAGRFDAETWYSLLERFGVSVWYTAPTALRMLMRVGEDLVGRYDLSALRHICSVGEPLNPEVIRWGEETLGLTIHDTWWQTETGSHMICNYPCLGIKPGSMGKPVPGVQAAVVDEDGNELPPNTEGYLALRPGWPSMMLGIWRNAPKFKDYFRVPGWYVAGDMAYIDEEGYFWFLGRADDVIKTSGERVGPFEVESALLEFPAVAEAGVIGKPDELRGEIIKAFISLRPGYIPSEDLKEEISDFVKERLAAHAKPREIEFREKLPKTRSGKIMRRLLKSWEVGEETGDVSTLEE
ncbi:MAG: acetate--CoA ligase [Methanomassiliicoccales archaeon]